MMDDTPPIIPGTYVLRLYSGGEASHDLAQLDGA